MTDRKSGFLSVLSAVKFCIYNRAASMPNSASSYSK